MYVPIYSFHKTKQNKTKQNTRLCPHFNCISLKQQNLEIELSVSDDATAQHDAGQTWHWIEQACW